jgi:hypothetical protein
MNADCGLGSTPTRLCAQTRNLRSADRLGTIEFYAKHHDL